MKMLITGGAGFIGLNFIRYMNKVHPQYNIVCVDALTYAGNGEVIRQYERHGMVQFYKGRIEDRSFMELIFAAHRFDTVVNFAAESHVDRSIQDPSLFMITNIIGTQVLLDLSRKYEVGRYHQISTDEVYGELASEMDELCFTEDSPLRPSSPYSASKASADLLVLAGKKTYGMDVTISRCSNNYGDYQHEEKLIPHVIQCAIQEKLIPVYGDGAQVRDWLHVEDHCRAVDAILHDGKSGEIYNAGGNHELTNLTLVRLILEIMGKSEKLITFTEDRPGHDRRYGVDSVKLRKQTGWEPQIKFREGLEETIAWYNKK